MKKTINGVDITVDSDNAVDMKKIETMLDELMEEFKTWLETVRRTGRIRPKKEKKIKKECAFTNFTFKDVFLKVEVGDLHTEFGVGKWKALHVDVCKRAGGFAFAFIKVPVAILDRGWEEVKKMSDGEIDKIIHA